MSLQTCLENLYPLLYFKNFRSNQLQDIGTEKFSEEKSSAENG